MSGGLRLQVLHCTRAPVHIVSVIVKDDTLVRFVNLSLVFSIVDPGWDALSKHQHRCPPGVHKLQLLNKRKCSQSQLYRQTTACMLSTNWLRVTCFIKNRVLTLYTWVTWAPCATLDTCWEVTRAAFVVDVKRFYVYLYFHKNAFSTFSLFC